ncbi:hypothetical protein [Geodermatophilus sp. DSM 45219]|uniref:hypothetical protein n=1 Tax=Geodermatophilus sp. DSM 45219 TaxID=1881103 RepID=UPI00088324DA|nr:hypothetical protein [Geodermatophilus sp. DSM 45219]SDN99999.1 type VI secretion system secreted protein VgrG [Geodermatophilus sp. DSM 45219]
MTTPETDGPGEPTRQLPAQPSVSTAPASAPRRWWSAVPHHLGRARTSTVVLALLFVGLYTLYLYVRPPDTTTVVPATGTTVETPAPSDVPLVPTETPEPTTEEPTTPEEESAAPTTAPETTPEDVPAEETPSGTAEPTAPAEETPAPAAPTTAAPTATGAPGS